MRTHEPTSGEGVAAFGVEQGPCRAGVVVGGQQLCDEVQHPRVLLVVAEGREPHQPVQPLPDRQTDRHSVPIDPDFHMSYQPPTQQWSGGGSAIRRALT
jgi:hypothetical protein